MIFICIPQHLCVAGIGLDKPIMYDSKEAVKHTELLRYEESNPVSMWQKFLNNKTQETTGDPVKSASDTSLLTFEAVSQVQDETEVVFCTSCGQEDLGRELEKLSGKRELSEMAGHVPVHPRFSPKENDQRVKGILEEMEAKGALPAGYTSDLYAEKNTMMYGNSRSKQEEVLSPDTLARMCKDISESAKKDEFKVRREGDFDFQPDHFSCGNSGKVSQASDVPWYIGNEFPKERSSGDDPVTLKTFDLVDESGKLGNFEITTTKIGQNEQFGRIDHSDQCRIQNPEAVKNVNLEALPSDSDEEWLVSEHAIDSSVAEIVKETEPQVRDVKAELSPTPSFQTDLLANISFDDEPDQCYYLTETKNLESNAQGDIGKDERTQKFVMSEDFYEKTLVKKALVPDICVDSTTPGISNSSVIYQRKAGDDPSPIYDCKEEQFEMDCFSVFPSTDFNDELPEPDVAENDDVSSPMNPIDVVDLLFNFTDADVGSEVNTQFNAADYFGCQEPNLFETKKPETDAVGNPAELSVDEDACLISWDAIENIVDHPVNETVTSDAFGSPISHSDDDVSLKILDAFGNSVIDTSLITLGIPEDVTDRSVDDECSLYALADTHNTITSEETKGRNLDALSTDDSCLSSQYTVGDLFDFSVDDTSLISLDHCSSYALADTQNTPENKGWNLFANLVVRTTKTTQDAPENLAGHSFNDTSLITLNECSSYAVADTQNIVTSAETIDGKLTTHSNLITGSELDATENRTDHSVNEISHITLNEYSSFAEADTQNVVLSAEIKGWNLIANSTDNANLIAEGANQRPERGGTASETAGRTAEIGNRTAQREDRAAQREDRTAERGVRAAKRGDSTAERGSTLAEKRLREAERAVREAEKAVRAAERGVIAAERGDRAAEREFKEAERGIKAAERGIIAAQRGVRAAERGVIAAETGDTEADLSGNDTNLIALDDCSSYATADTQNIVTSAEIKDMKLTAYSVDEGRPITQGATEDITDHSVNEKSQTAQDGCSSCAVADTQDVVTSGISVMDLFPCDERHYKTYQYFVNATRRTQDCVYNPINGKLLNDLIPYFESDEVTDSPLPEIPDENLNTNNETLDFVDLPEIRGVSRSYLEYYSQSTGLGTERERDGSDVAYDETYSQELPVIPEEDMLTDVSEQCDDRAGVEYPAAYPRCSIPDVAVQTKTFAETQTLRENAEDNFNTVPINEKKFEENLKVFRPHLYNYPDFVMQTYPTLCEFPPLPKTFYTDFGESCFLDESESTNNDPDGHTRNPCDLVIGQRGDIAVGTPVVNLSKCFYEKHMDINPVSEKTKVTSDPALKTFLVHTEGDYQIQQSMNWTAPCPNAKPFEVKWKVSGSGESQPKLPADSECYKDGKSSTDQNVWLSRIEEESDESEDKRLIRDLKSFTQTVEDSLEVVEKVESSAVFRPQLTPSLPKLDWYKSRRRSLTAVFGIGNDDFESPQSEQSRPNLPDLEFAHGILETENQESTEISDEYSYPGEKVFRVPKCVLKGIVNYEKDYDDAMTLDKTAVELPAENHSGQNLPGSVLPEGSYIDLSGSNQSFSDDPAWFVRNTCIRPDNIRYLSPVPFAEMSEGCVPNDSGSYKHRSDVNAVTELNRHCDSKSAEHSDELADRYSPCNTLDRILPTDSSMPSDTWSGPTYESPAQTESFSTEAESLQLPGPESILHPCLEAWFCSETSRNGKPNSFMIESEAQTEEESTGLLANISENTRPRIAERNTYEFVEQVTRYGTAGLTVHCVDRCKSPIKSSGSYSGPEADASESSINEGFGNYSLIDSDSGEKCIPQRTSFVPPTYADRCDTFSCNVASEACSADYSQLIDLEDDLKLGSTGDSKTIDGRQPPSSCQKSVVATTLPDRDEHGKANSETDSKSSFTCLAGSDPMPFEDDWHLDCEDDMEENQQRLKKIIVRYPKFQSILAGKTSGLSMDYVLEDDACEEDSKEDKEQIEKEIIARDLKFQSDLEGMTSGLSMDYVLEEDIREEDSKQDEEEIEKEIIASDLKFQSILHGMASAFYSDLTMDYVLEEDACEKDTKQDEKQIEKENNINEDSKEAVEIRKEKSNEEKLKKAEEIEKENKNEEESKEEEEIWSWEKDNEQDNAQFMGRFFSMDRPPSPFADDWFADCGPDRSADHLAKGSKEYENFIRETSTALEKCYDRVLAGTCTLVRQVKQVPVCPEPVENEKELTSENVFLPGELSAEFEQPIRTGESSIESVYLTPIFNPLLDDIPLKPCPNDSPDFVDLEGLGPSNVTATSSSSRDFTEAFIVPRTPVLDGTLVEAVERSLKAFAEVGSQEISVEDVPDNQEYSARDMQMISAHDITDIPDTSFHSMSEELWGTCPEQEQSSEMDSGGSSFLSAPEIPQTSDDSMDVVADCLVKKAIDYAQYKILKTTNSLPFNLRVTDGFGEEDG